MMLLPQVHHAQNIKDFSHPLKIQEQALELLNQGKKNQALVLLHSSFYKFFSFEAYTALKNFNKTPSIHFVIWHLSACFFFLLSGFLLWKVVRNNSNPIKVGLFYSFGLTLLLFSGFFILKKRGSPLKLTSLKQAPLDNSEALLSVQPGDDLKILKKQGKWYQVDFQNQKAWIPIAEIQLTRK